jgi:excisionase family DNA binding protein
MLTTTQAAERLGISRVRVAAMIRTKRLKAQKIGRDWVIDEKDLAAVKDRKPGRPSKRQTTKAR